MFLKLFLKIVLKKQIKTKRKQLKYVIQKHPIFCFYKQKAKIVFGYQIYFLYFFVLKNKKLFSKIVTKLTRCLFLVFGIFHLSLQVSEKRFQT